MNNNELSAKDYQIYLLKSLLWLSLAWGGFILTQINFFHAWIIWALFLLLSFWLTKTALDNSFSLKLSKEMLIASFTFLLIVVFFSFFSTPTVFTGRDQGSFSEAAIRLSQNHSLKFSTPTSAEFFKLHEPGRAQNFPGFYYTNDGKLITQFSLAYISWLALFFSVFGITGFILANGILLYFFFFSFYLLLRLFLKKYTATGAMLLAGTSFVFMWFSKMTLSENMALPLLWTSILALMLLLKNQKLLYYLVFLLSSILLCFARIEGFAFFAVSIIVIGMNKDTREYLKENISLKIVLPLVIFAIFLALNIFNDIYFYKEIAKALLPTVTLPKAKYLNEIRNNVLPSFYIERILYIYGLLGFFVVGGISIAIKFWKKELYKLVPFFIILPTFVYFVDDHISADHPWMLRRFMFSLLPVGILYASLMLGRFFENKDALKFRILSVIIGIILFIGNFPAFFKYVTFSENKNLLTETREISSQFSSNDLILIDQNATNDGWSMISGPMNSLYGKNAVYFFNTQDLSKLDLSKFENVYLISPNSQVPYYLNSTIGKRLTETNKYNFTITKLDTSNEGPLNKIMLPQKKTFVIQGKIFKVSKETL